MVNLKQSSIRTNKTDIIVEFFLWKFKNKPKIKNIKVCNLIVKSRII